MSRHHTKKQAHRKAARSFVCFRERPLHPEEGVKILYSKRFVLGNGVIIALVSISMKDTSLRRLQDIGRAMGGETALLGCHGYNQTRILRGVYRFPEMLPGGDQLLKCANEIARRMRSITGFPVIVSPFGGLRRTPLLLHLQALA